MRGKFLSAREVADLLGCHHDTILRLARLGRVDVERVGTMYLFDATAIQQARSQLTGTRRRRVDYPELVDANTDDYLSVPEVGAVLGLTERQIWRLITDGALQGHRWKGLVLIEKTQAIALQQARIEKRTGAAGHGRSPGADADGARDGKADA